MSTAPIEGTITFLLTDIEGSTRLWDLHTEAMRLALRSHDRLLAETIAQHDGYVIRSRGEGDSFFAVFARATDAVAAALDAQQALQAEPWSTSLPVRVRMALHTGEAELREGDYYGTAVNRCARVRTAAHGEQVLLTAATYELVRDALPERASVIDLGPHRLKDLGRAERIFQLAAPGLRQEFPPLHSLDAWRHNLPVQLTPLIGRERDLGTVCELIKQDAVRLVTLTGPGGAGKTRLGLQVAADLQEQFPDGVFFVPLASLTDPDLVVFSIAQALGLRESGTRPIFDGLLEHLRDRRLLLLLDNFEQLMSAAAHVATLLQAASGLKVLVTSRAPLRLRGEKEVAVPPLALPDLARLPSLETLSQYAAVELFIQRAQDVKPDFQVTNENAPAVAEICHRLDGLPLAIELAAARIRLFSPQNMLARLEQRLKLLVGGARDLPARQQTLRGAITWSYELLEAEVQTVLRRLSVFVGGASLDAAEAVCNAAGDLSIDMLEGLQSLAEQSLIQLAETTTGEDRFSMLETIREYGWECLKPNGELEAIRQQHAEFFLSLGEADPAKEQLEIEHDNLRAALSWYLETNQVERARRLSIALYDFWYTRGFWTEGREHLSALLALLADQQQPEQYAQLLRLMARLHWLQGDRAAAQSLLGESVTILRPLGKTSDLATSDSAIGELAASLSAMGEVAMATGDYDAARHCFEECRAIVQEVGTLIDVGWAVHSLGFVALQQGHSTARPLLEESLALFQRADHPRGIAWATYCLGEEARRQGESSARTLLEEALRQLQSIGARRGIAFALSSLGELARSEGDFRTAPPASEQSISIQPGVGQKGGMASTNRPETVVSQHHRNDVARSYLQESLTIRHELGERAAIATCLEQIAGLEASEGGSMQGARLLGAAHALRQAVGVTIPPIWLAEHQRVVAALRSALGETVFQQAWAEGEAMTLESIVAQALATGRSGGRR